MLFCFVPEFVWHFVNMVELPQSRQKNVIADLMGYPGTLHQTPHTVQHFGPEIMSPGLTCYALNLIPISVLLRAVLGDHPLEAGSRVPQAAGEGGRR